MDRVGADAPRERDDRVGVEVGAHRMAALTDLVGLVGLDAVNRTAIVRRVDRDAANSQLVGRAEDPDSDLATIGDEQLSDHGMPARSWDAPTAPRMPSAQRGARALQGRDWSA